MAKERSIHVVSAIDGTRLKTVTLTDEATVNDILVQAHEEDGTPSRLIQGEKVLHPRMSVMEAGLADGEEVSLIRTAYCQRASLPVSGYSESEDESLDQYKDPHGQICVQVPSEVESIADGAFADNHALVKLLLHDAVAEIGKRACKGCVNLKEVVIPGSVTDAVRRLQHEVETVTTIGEGAFFGCTSLEHVMIPNSVTSIGAEVFCGCSSLEQVVIPNSVTSLDTCVFAGCDSLKQVDIPASVTIIGAGAFRGCSSLEEVVIPKSIKVIEAAAFAGCSNLKQVHMSNSVTKIYSGAFADCNSLEKLEIPEAIIFIANGAFRGCNNLKKVVIPKSVANIDTVSNMVESCPSMKLADIPTSVPGIDQASGEGSLEKVVIPSGHASTATQQGALESSMKRRRLQ